MSILGDFRAFLAAGSLNLHIASNRWGSEQPLVFDFDIDDKATPATANNARLCRQLPGRNGAKVMDGQVCRRHFFVCFNRSENHECGRCIDKRSYRAAMNYALVLLQLVANIEADSYLAALHLTQFEAQEFCVSDRLKHRAGAL